MAKSVIINKPNGTVKSISTSDYDAVKITNQEVNSKVIEQPRKVKTVKPKDYPITKIENVAGTVKVSQELPFRIKFINIGIPGYSSTNVPPIGIAIIGVNNYIL